MSRSSRRLDELETEFDDHLHNYNKSKDSSREWRQSSKKDLERLDKKVDKLSDSIKKQLSEIKTSIKNLRDDVNKTTAKITQDVAANRTGLSQQDKNQRLCVKELVKRIESSTKEKSARTKLSEDELLEIRNLNDKLEKTCASLSELHNDTKMSLSEIREDVRILKTNNFTDQNSRSTKSYIATQGTDDSVLCSHLIKSRKQPELQFKIKVAHSYNKDSVQALIQNAIGKGSIWSIHQLIQTYSGEKFTTFYLNLRPRVREDVSKSIKRTSFNLRSHPWPACEEFQTKIRPWFGPPPKTNSAPSPIRKRVGKSGQNIMAFQDNFITESDIKDTTQRLEDHKTSVALSLLTTPTNVNDNLKENETNSVSNDQVRLVSFEVDLGSNVLGIIVKKNASGLGITEIHPGGAISKSTGLKIGDIITAINKRSVQQLNENEGSELIRHHSERSSKITLDCIIINPKRHPKSASRT